MATSKASCPTSQVGPRIAFLPGDVSMWEINMTATIGGSMPGRKTLLVVLGGHTSRSIQA